MICQLLFRTPNYTHISRIRGSKKNNAQIKIYIGELYQFQFMTTYKFIFQQLKNDENNERVISFIYLIINRKF